MNARHWNSKADDRAARLARAADALGHAARRQARRRRGHRHLLEAVIEPGDRVCLEGNNQKQADFLAKALVQVDPQRVHGLHMVQSVLALPEHLDIFENGIASRLDFSFSGPQGARLAKLVSAGRIEIGAIHTYLELFARYFVDLTPKVALVAAQAADARGQPLHRPQHRGHAGHRRGHGLLGRHRDRAGQRDGRRQDDHAAAHRHPGRLGRASW